MHIVYIIEFSGRVVNNQYPCYYIGSKSNCHFSEGRIIDSNGKPYYGSSTSLEYNSLIFKEQINISILFETDNYEECLSMERRFQQKYDVVADIRFFNKAIATINTYSNPEYATYKHVDYTNHVRRLPINHPLVLAGIWVGVTKGRVKSPEERKLHGRSGSLNAFYGKTHSIQTLENNKKIFKEWVENNPEYRTLMAESASKRFKGKSKTKEQKDKMSESSKGYVTLKHKVTLNSIRVKRESSEYKSLNLEEWATPYILRERVNVECDVCNKNGIDSATFRRWHFKNCKKGKDNEQHNQNKSGDTSREEEGI